MYSIVCITVVGASWLSGTQMFWYIFDGEPIAENGFLQLRDDVPGLGLALKTEYLDQFQITE